MRLGEEGDPSRVVWHAPFIPQQLRPRPRVVAGPHECARPVGERGAPRLVPRPAPRAPAVPPASPRAHDRGQPDEAAACRKGGEQRCRQRRGVAPTGRHAHDDRVRVQEDDVARSDQEERRDHRAEPVTCVSCAAPVGGAAPAQPLSVPVFWLRAWLWNGSGSSTRGARAQSRSRS